MNSYDTAAGTAQDDWLAGLMVTEEPKTVAPAVAQPPALPATPTPNSGVSCGLRFHCRRLSLLRFRFPPAAAPGLVPTPPPVPASAPPAPVGENWLAMVMPEAAANSMRTPIKPGVSLRQKAQAGREIVTGPSDADPNRKRECFRCSSGNLWSHSC